MSSMGEYSWPGSLRTRKGARAHPLRIDSMYPRGCCVHRQRTTRISVPGPATRCPPCGLRQRAEMLGPPGSSKSMSMRRADWSWIRINIYRLTMEERIEYHAQEIAHST